jgi:hypothetical protein
VDSSASKFEQMEIDCSKYNEEIGVLEVNTIDIYEYYGTKKYPEPILSVEEITNIDDKITQASVDTKTKNELAKESKPKHESQTELEKKFEDICNKHTGIQEFGKWQQSYKDPMYVFDKKSNAMKWSEKGMTPKQQRDFTGHTQRPEHALKTLDKQIMQEPYEEYKDVYFPEGQLQKN